MKKKNIIITLPWNVARALRVSSMSLSIFRLVATICLAVPVGSTTTKAFLDTPSSASKVPYFLQILPERSASRVSLHCPSIPPSALKQIIWISIFCVNFDTCTFKYSSQWNSILFASLHLYLYLYFSWSWCVYLNFFSNCSANLKVKI